MNILFEDNHIIVCEKEAGIPTQSGKVTEKDMVSELNNYLIKSARAVSKAPADLKVYLIHRLDKPVRGILVFAKNKQSAARINTQMQNDSFNKRYYALVEGKPAESSAILENYMYKDSKLSRSFIVHDDKLEINKISTVSKNKNSSNKQIKNNDTQHTDAKLPINKEDIKFAKLEYSTFTSGNPDEIFGGLKQGQASEYTLLDIKLITGRFHQIRCQLSEIGCPIVSDTLYGAKTSLKNRKAIGLIAYSLEFDHPVTGKHMTFKLPIQLG